MTTTEGTIEAASEYRLGDYLLGIEGLAVLRAAQRRQYGRIPRRRVEIEAIAAGYEEPPLSEQRGLPEADLDQGYTAWAETYDHPTELDPDPILALEGPVMRNLITELPDGPVLDAACGTGRHTRFLVEAGHEVIGIDSNEGMLAVARAKLPAVQFRRGDLRELPVDDASFRAVTCGLAFGHLPEIGPAVDELARVVEPGGLVAISAPHPFVTAILGWRAPIFDADGNGYEVPEFGHGHGAYVDAFAGADLAIRQCIEPRLTEAQARWRPDASEDEENPFAEALEDALAGQPGALVWVVEKA